MVYHNVFQHTAARRRLGFSDGSRIAIACGFNTQPPEGGWSENPTLRICIDGFNTQPPEGGWIEKFDKICRSIVSTHSRPKAAGKTKLNNGNAKQKFQHTAARRRLARHLISDALCRRFNTQPPEGGWPTTGTMPFCLSGFQHTAARRRLAKQMIDAKKAAKFQHTAARRRLDTRHR